MFIKAYDRFITGLGVFAGILFAISVLIIGGEVLGRDTGWYAWRWTFPSVAYIMEFSTMFAGPWVLHNHGHIFMVAVRNVLRPRPRVILEKAVYLVCLLASGLITVFAAMATWNAIVTHSIDFRSINVPGWVLYAALVLGFGLMSIEFARYLFGSRSMYVDDDVKTDAEGAA